MVDEGVEDDVEGVVLDGLRKTTKTIEMTVVVLAHKTDKVLITQKVLLLLLLLIWISCCLWRNLSEFSTDDGVEDAHHSLPVEGLVDGELVGHEDSKKRIERLCSVKHKGQSTIERMLIFCDIDDLQTQRVEMRVETQCVCL